MLGRMSLRMRILSREKKIAAVLLLLLLGVALLGPQHVLNILSLTNPRENTTHSQRDILNRLRSSLRDNMNEFIGPGTGATFLPKGKVQRLTSMDAVTFNDHVMSSEPFILSNPDYTCTKTKWDLDFVRKEAGDDMVGIETSKSNRFYSNEGLRKVSMTVKEFLDKFKSPDRPYDMYLAEENVKQFPKLEADVQYPMFTDSFNIDKIQVWIGAGGQVSPLHHDQWDNILCQIQGERQLTLYDPFQSHYIYPKKGLNRHFAQVDPQHPDYAAFPEFRKAVATNVTLKQGEILFVPAHWWHQVHHKASTNIAVNFWFMPSLLGELLMDIILPEGDNYA